MHAFPRFLVVRIDIDIGIGIGIGTGMGGFTFAFALRLHFHFFKIHTLFASQFAKEALTVAIRMSPSNQFFRVFD